MHRLTAAALSALLGLSGPAMAQDAASSGDSNPAAASAEEEAQRQLPDGGRLRADDLRRLSQVDRSYGQALRQAMAGADEGDLQLLLAALRGQPMTVGDARAAMPGDWSCQMMKVGGGLPLVVYAPFKCRADTGGGFEKLTGSQRTKGDLFDWESQLIYVGTGFVWDSSPVPYADLPEEADPSAYPQLMPEVGIVELTDADAGRIIFPDPYLESRMNVLVLRR